MKSLIIIGASGYGREVYNSAIESIGYMEEFEVKGFIDDNLKALDGLDGYPPILGTIKDYLPQQGDVFVCAIGSVLIRKKVSESILERGGAFFTLIHKTAYISKNVVLGKGCMLLAGARIHCDVRIGDYVIVQPFAIIGHDCVIGNWCLINTYSDLGGGSKLGEGVTLQINSFVMPQAVVGDYATIGAGSVTIRRVKAGQTVFGVPAMPVIAPKP